MNHKGFTLIELLVVIAIIGILSSVVLTSLNTARRKGRDSRRVADIKQLQLALELYYDANGSYPDALTVVNLVDTGFISVVPLDPSGTSGGNGGAYYYDLMGTGNDYRLGANLEDSLHPALRADADATDGPNVEGTDSDSCEDSAVPNRYCYDVKP